MSASRPGRAANAHDILHRERRQPLGALFAPRAVAVIGASARPGSVGRALAHNLQEFPGPVYLINPARPEIDGRPSYPDLRSVPGPVDLAVIATPAATVPGVLDECAAAGVGAAIIISAGFKETGPAGARLEAEVLAAARRGGLRLLGPNCLGLLIPPARLNASFARGGAEPGGVAFISQSGALCTAVLDWSRRARVGFSAFVSIGSMLDVGWGDLITYFGDDPHTRSIVCYMESVGDARAFLSAAREVALTKPIIVLKVGRTAAAAQAAASHTGSLTGSDAVLDAAFDRAGVLRVERIEELFDLAEVLAQQPLPRGNRLAVVTNAGGPAALATDALVTAGGRLAPLSDATLTALNEFLPAPWSHGNPIDILGDADAGRYARAVELAARNPDTDGVLVILTPQDMTDAVAIAGRLKPFAQLDGKPLLASWMGGDSVVDGRNELAACGIPNYAYPDRAARAFQLMADYQERLRALYETPALLLAPESLEGGGTVTEVLRRAQAAGRTLLTEAEAKQVLQAYGIPTVPTRVARTEAAAVREAERLGYPVVLKLYSETLTHKTDVGGVELDLGDEAAVRRAWGEIAASVAARAGAQHFLGVTVQPMLKLDGYELILGSSTDPQFGPVLLFGTGGQLVEVFQDRALGLPPLNTTLARRLMARTRIFTALQGVRGRAAVPLAVLEELLVRFSHLVVEHPRIAEIDINPLLASPDRLVALDARIVLHPAAVADAQLPRPAIRPYPAQYIRPWKLKDRSHAVIRPICPEDEPLLVAFHRQLSERSVYQRYFTPLKLDTRILHQRLSRLCAVDYDREMALVVERREPATGHPEILGVGRLSRLHGTREAEFALVVADAWQGQGLGTELLRMLVQAGRDERLERITATMLADNHAMQHLARAAGFTLRHEAGTAEYHAQLDLAPAG